MVDLDPIAEARQVFDIEIESLQKVRDELDENFSRLVKAIRECRGRVILTGIGKSGHVAKKIAATLSSLGTPLIICTRQKEPTGIWGDYP